MKFKFRCKQCGKYLGDLTDDDKSCSKEVLSMFTCHRKECMDKLKESCRKK